LSSILKIRRRTTGNSGMALASSNNIAATSTVQGILHPTAFRPLITILVFDFEDSSSLCEKLGDLRAHEVVRVHNEILRHVASGAAAAK
jgi:hypothetical protein